MADWYVSSASYAAIPTFTPGATYAVGAIVRPNSPAQTAQYPQRVSSITTGIAGGSEPTWSTSNNGTTTSGGVTFTNVGGQSAYGWSAAIGNMASFNSSRSKIPGLGDRVWLASDSAETITGNGDYVMNSNNSFNTIKVISVNRLGSVPPVASDVQAGAAITISNDFHFDQHCMTYWDGVTFTLTGGGTVFLNNGGGGKTSYYKNCRFAGMSRFDNTQGPCKIVFDNVTLGVSSTSFTFKSSQALDFTWINTPSAFTGSTAQPTSLFNGSDGSGMMNVQIRGVDLSYLTGTLLAAAFNTGGRKILLDSCKVNSAVTRYQTPSDGNSLISFDEIELANCFDGTNVLNERYTPHGIMTTDTSTYMTGGASDGVNNFSQKLVTNGSPTSELVAGPIESMWFDVDNSATGSSKTATVEIVSSSSLNNTDIKLQLEYQGTSGSPVTSFVESNANVMTASAALPSSSATWNSPPSTPVYQKIQAAFTPQRAGRVRARVLLGKASTTVRVNPQIAIS